MKKLNYILLLAITGLIFGSCNDDDYSLGTPTDKTQALMGEWEVKSVILTDEAGTKKEMDITPYFNFDTYRITFTQNKNFTIEASNTTPNFVGLLSGTWSYDDAEAPSQIKLTDGNSSSQFTLLAPPRQGNNLKIKFIRYEGDKAIVSYRYEFTPKLTTKDE